MLAHQSAESWRELRVGKPPRWLPRRAHEARQLCERSKYLGERRLVELGFGNRTPLPGIGISPLEFFVQYAASDLGKSRLNLTTAPGEFQGSAFLVEVEGERDGHQAHLILEAHLLKMGGGDPTSVCARVAMETWLRGELHGPGLLAIESALEPERYIREVVRDTGMILHEREEIIRMNCFRTME